MQNYGLVAICCPHVCVYILMRPLPEQFFSFLLYYCTDAGQNTYSPDISLLKYCWFIYYDGLRNGLPEFDSRQRKYFSVLHNQHTGSGTHRASYIKDRGSWLPKGKYRDAKLTADIQLVPRWRMANVDLHSPTHPHREMLNWLSTGKILLSTFYSLRYDYAEALDSVSP
jgi:hypothetical protein